MVDVNFDGFDGRKEQLSKILRFIDTEKQRFTPMFYRTNLLLHSERLYFLMRDVANIIINSYDGIVDLEKALTLALVHDDAEIVTGDVQLYHKDRMTAEQLAEVQSNEERAIECLSKRWPYHINGFAYKDLLRHALRKDCLEAHIVSYLDKLDGFCESLHEIHAGNERFAGPATDYSKRLRLFTSKFPPLCRILPSHHPLLSSPRSFDADRVLAEGKLHSSESVRRTTQFLFYDRWREITLEYFGEEALLGIRER